MRIIPASKAFEVCEQAAEWFYFTLGRLGLISESRLLQAYEEHVYWLVKRHKEGSWLVVNGKYTCVTGQEYIKEW